MIGRTISHYRILAELGTGGMGVVYRAEDLTLGRQVAVKFLSPNLNADPDARRRFVHEAKAAAALDHSGICTVYEAGEADGQPFIVMALLQGQTLKGRIAQGPLPIPESVSIALQVAEALHEAHGKGVVHRDIKPANIMLAPNGQAKVMDFGLAQVAGASRLTRSGSTMGTAAYLSPEQARGEGSDGRSDLWSLGVVLYEMACGRRPFQGDHPVALLNNLLSAAPEPLTGLRTGVPLELERIVDKCLAKETGRRYQHADELAVDLRRLLADLEVTQTVKLALTNQMSRSRPRWLRASVLLPVLLVVIAVTTWTLLRPGRTPSSGDAALAVMSFDDLGGTADSLSAAGLDGLLQIGLIEHCSIRVVSPEYLQDLRRRLFSGDRGAIKADQALEVARKAGASLLLLGQIGQRDGSTFAVWRLVETANGRGVGGQRVVAADLFALADGIIAQIVPFIAGDARAAPTEDPGSVGEITTASAAAYREFVAGEEAFRAIDFDGALPRFQAAVEIDSTFALAWMRLATIHWLNSMSPFARDCADRAWSLRSHLGIKDRMMLESRRLEMDRNIPAAMDIYREMLTRWPDDRLIVQAYCQAVFWYWMWPETQTIAEHGLARFPDDEHLGRLRCLALIYSGREAEAYTSVAEFLRRHPGEALGWDLLGEAHLAAGEPDSAAVAFRQARDLAPDAWDRQLDLARCATVRGDVAQAEAIFEQLLAQSDLSVVQRRVAMTGYNEFPGMATLCASTGRLRLAREWLDAAWPNGGMDPRVAHAGFLLAAEQPNEALKVLRDIDPSKISRWTQLWLESVRVFALTRADSLDEARAARSAYLAEPDLSPAQKRHGPLVTRAVLSLAEGHPDSALAALAELEEITRLSASDLRTRARAYRALGRLPEAAATLERLLKRYGSYFLARYELGEIYESLGRRNDASWQYEVFLQAWEHADPGFPQVDDARRRLAALRAMR